MGIGGGVIFLVLAILGLCLAANLRQSASILGQYLIGRRRIPWEYEHRRERCTRAVGIIFAMLAADTAITSISAPNWLRNVTFFVVLAIGVALWVLTNGTHGPEFPDDEPSKKIY